MGSERRRQEDVLRYWRAVELFSPPTLPQAVVRGGRASHREWGQRIDVRPGAEWPLLPWQAGHPLLREPIDDTEEVWRHTVYGGVFSLDRIREALEERFGGDPEDHAGTRVGGHTSVFAFTVDAEGRLLQGTNVFSSCAWATGRIRDPGPQDPAWLDGFDEAEAECGEAIALLTKHHIPYLEPSSGAANAPVSSIVPPPRTAPGGWPAPAPAPAPVPVTAAPADWRAIVGEILGGAAVGALGALFGDMGAGIVAGALTPVARRVAGRMGGRTAAPPAPLAPPIVPPQPPGPDGSARTGGTPNDTGADTDTDAETAPDNGADEAGRPVELADLVAFAAHVADLCGVSDLVDPASIRIHSERVRRRKDGTLPDADPAFLNSFLPDDLARVTEGAADGYGAALTAYLADGPTVDTAGRRDVRVAPDAVLEGIAPATTPLGRWPAPVAHPLALSQQFAVNRMTAQLSEGSGLFSVNGPPGTGKTTMLRDLIAAVVVERARALSGYDAPGEVFAGETVWNREGVRRTVKVPAADVTGHEIVVASSNNGAVQNITAELPALDALGEEWHAEASYFLDQAAALLGGETPAWGAIAAPLGKADNRKKFLERYWWGERPKKPARGRTRSGPGAVRDERQPVPGLHAVLRDLERGGAALRDPAASVRYRDPGARTPAAVEPGDAPEAADWETARGAFLDAVRHAEALRDARSAVAEALRHLPSDEAALRAAELRDGELLGRERAARTRLNALEGDRDRIAADWNQAQTDLGDHGDARPGGVRAALGRGSALQHWQAREQHLRGEADRLARAFADLAEPRDEARRLLAAVEGERHGERRRVEELRTRCARRRDALAAARRDWPDHLPENWLERTEAERELAAPWSDPELCAARTRVFLAALDLHRAFVVANAFTVRRNLLLLKEVFSGVAPQAVSLAVWQTLFLALPVVSTTFASCGRLFGPLGRESLGWLLIDEAGQAAPQAAVGALWRSRRAVLLGDPLQLEPVVQLLRSVQEKLREAHGVAEEWLPSRTSAQRVADRVNTWGTYLADERPDEDSGTVWVGAPLRVHRRCEEPMFSLSNDIAYDGLMVYGTADRAFPGPGVCVACEAADVRGCEACVYSRTCWVDVRAGEARGGKWVPEEGRALAATVDKLRGRWGVGADRIRVISPFRDVVKGCERALRTFPRDQIGTVHTMQGKEADVVILVLGTRPQEGGRARAWAAESPNLLNVAVSRAKRRLFVIGDHRAWRDHPYFDLLADPDRLPVRRWAPRAER